MFAAAVDGHIDIMRLWADVRPRRHIALALYAAFAPLPPRRGAPIIVEIAFMT
ncbi:hypothetical protein SM11_pC0939 (plasmid) [Sinorhizobium meliloti SM11]|uniref:Uncharacterized protein n=1 Tax=Sinorhizobium meliloti (strain SM11) TaxID=707241 RepID=F7XEN7_SINMM|nr:hypothetical protein SM11_pC0939 [Sinorhizobium meliloti SM11]